MMSLLDERFLGPITMGPSIGAWTITALVLVVTSFLLMRRTRQQKQNALNSLADFDDLLVDMNHTDITWNSHEDSSSDDATSSSCTSATRNVQGGTTTEISPPPAAPGVKDSSHPSSIMKENKQDDPSDAAMSQEQGLKNVFDVKQAPPNVGKHQPDATTTSSTAKTPFKSSYYYAHNQHRKTGGYTDGLKTEDYQMNGPKLLSRRSSIEATTSNQTAPVSGGSSFLCCGHEDSIPINRYMWDDEGSANGIAKIYIETLPGKTPSNSIRWNEAQITKDDVTCKLLGTWKNGLMVHIRATADSQSYHLYVPRMYGEVDEVKTILKPNKLIVKLLKKKNKENLRAWPQLSSTVPALK